MSLPETNEAEGGCMDEAMGPLSSKRTWSTVDGRYSYQIVWTAEQLRRIGQAIEQGDAAYLARVEEAMRQALNAALTSQVSEANEDEVKMDATLGGKAPHHPRYMVIGKRNG